MAEANNQGALSLISDDWVDGYLPRSEDTVIEEAVAEYLSGADHSLSIPEARDAMLSVISAACKIENMDRHAHSRIIDETKGRRAPFTPITAPKALDEMSIVSLLLAREHIVVVDLTGKRRADDAVLLAVYRHSGPDAGLYVTGETEIAALASQARPSLKSKDIESLLKRMRYHAPRRTRTLDSHLVPVNNGIYNHRTRALEDFSPEHVFLTKSPVDYDPHAESPVITMPDGEEWEVGQWIADLSDDEGVPELLWEIISAGLRPGVRWDKAVFLHSSRGNNGKGTFCALLRSVIGVDGCASVPIADFGKPFALSELVHARAIITDENSVGAFARDLGDFKSVVTGDAFTLDRKYKDPVSVSFSGLVVQCVNDFPKSRDKSASYTRRQLFVPFRKWFGDVERSYIKQDYLQRPEVLRYVLRVALEMDHEEFSNPLACQDLLEQFQRENSPVHDFWAEFEDQFVWDLLPTSFLYQLFVAWFRQTHPSGIPVNRNDFSTQLVELLSDSTYWDYRNTQKKHRPGMMMSKPEPLIAAYNLVDWQNAGYQGKTTHNRCIPYPLKANYIGVRRIQPVAVPGDDEDNDDDHEVA